MLATSKSNTAYASNSLYIFTENDVISYVSAKRDVTHPTATVVSYFRSASNRNNVLFGSRFRDKGVLRQMPPL